MKSVFDSPPEFSVSFTHCGVTVMFSGKVSPQDYLSTAGSEEENEERLGRIAASALQQAAQPVCQRLIECQREFAQALRLAQQEDYQSFPSAPHPT